MLKNKCYQGGLKHKFQPRYTEKKRDVSSLKVKNIDSDSLRKLITLNEYVYDICVWCGLKVYNSKK